MSSLLQHHGDDTNFVIQKHKRGECPWAEEELENLENADEWEDD